MATTNPDAAPPEPIGVTERLKRYVAFSRLPHVLLDIATPAMAALLWLGYFPSALTVILGMFTAFSGYTAIYALNDMVDRRVDREKMDVDDRSHDAYLDAIGGRHPVAQGLLSSRQAWIWIIVWGLFGTVGAFLLRPVCMIIFLSGGVLEAAYCVLYRVTPLRVFLCGVIKTLGGVAAIFVVDPRPDAGQLALIVAMVFFWEIGGQNIPADWTDIEEDVRMEARTVPVRLGSQWATVAILICLIAAIAVSVVLLQVFGGRGTQAFIGADLLAGAGLLVYPSIALLLRRERLSAQAVFNSASYYPLALLAIMTVRAVV